MSNEDFCFRPSPFARFCTFCCVCVVVLYSHPRTHTAFALNFREIRFFFRRISGLISPLVLEILEQQGVELSGLQRKTGEQEELIGRLERDLAVLGGRSSSSEPDDLTTLEVLEHLGNEGIRPTDGSIISILTAQRDRLRQKVSSLEEELVAAKTREKVQQSEIEKRTDDNVKLYGKIKFLQSGYGGKGSVAVPMDPAGNYSEQYEQRLDPFTKFSQAEKHRTYNKLKLHDRATLTIGKAIMSSGTARLMFFFYLVLVHLMIFLVLYRTAFAEMVDDSYQKNCVENFAQHMKDHHTEHR